jgi:hypothetical protein
MTDDADATFLADERAAIVAEGCGQEIEVVRRDVASGVLIETKEPNHD